MKDRAHAGAHHLAVVHVDAVGTQQAAKATEPRQRAQDGAEVAGVLHLVQVDRSPRLGCGRREQRHDRGDALRRTRLADLRHLLRLHHVHGQRARPVREVAREIDLAAAEALVVLRGLLQFLHQVLALDDEEPQLLAELLLVQLLDVFEFHARLRATASATLMPSTPADRIPPAYPAPSPQGYSPRTLRLCRVSASRVMRTGEEVRLSTPVSTASSRSKPGICRPNTGNASRIASMAYAGNAGARSPSRTPGVYEGVTAPSWVEGTPRRKSPSSCPGAQ